jgi:hypothetical protein
MRFLKVAVIGMTLTGLVFAGGEAHYIGADKCAKMCHKAKSKGEQLVIWQKTKHAQAYADLATPAALETAKKAGVTGDPQKADACLKCHVTGYTADASLKDSTYSMKDGISCEACHGPGSNYNKLGVMKDKKAAIAAGLIEPTEAVCVKCHNKESPNYKEFIFADMAKKIAHPKPAAETAPAAK